MTGAILFLVEATAACGPVAPARLGGGAEVVRAVLQFEEAAAEPFATTLVGLSQSTGPAQDDAKSKYDSDPARAQCKLAPATIA